MNVGGIIFLKWAVCICMRSSFIFLVSACSLAHFYRWKKKQQLKSFAVQKPQILNFLLYRENLMEAIMYNAYSQHLGDEL